MTSIMQISPFLSRFLSLKFSSESPNFEIYAKQNFFASKKEIETDCSTNFQLLEEKRRRHSENKTNVDIFCCVLRNCVFDATRPKKKKKTKNYFSRWKRNGLQVESLRREQGFRELRYSVQQFLSTFFDTAKGRKTKKKTLMPSFHQFCNLSCK